MGLVTVLRPNEGPGASLADDSDGTYVTATTAISQYRVGTFAVPAGDRIEWARLRFRHSNPTNNGATLNYYLGIEGSNPPNFSAQGVVPTSTLVTTTDAQRSLNREGDAWSQADIDNLWAQFWPFDGNIRLIEAYIDVSVNRRPVVSGITPLTGATVTASRPTYAWVFTDADGDTQRSYEIKVYRLADTPTPDPDSTTPWWTSGEVLSGSTSKQQAKDFTANGSVRVFIRASQPWSLPGGTFWSAWVSVDLNVVMTQPATPTIKVNPDSDRARTLVAVTSADQAAELCNVEWSDDQLTWLPLREARDAPRPGNLLSTNQASLETDTTGWTAGANTAIARSTTVGGDVGAAALRLTAAAVGSVAAVTSVGTKFAVLPGMDVSAFVSTRAGSTGRNVRIGVQWWAADGTTFLSETAVDTGADASGAWRRDVVHVVAPAGAYFMSMAVYVGLTGASAGAGEIHYADRFGLFGGQTSDWVAPGTAGTLRFYDHEAPQRGTRYYRAYLVDTAGGGRASSAMSAVARATWHAAGNWLKDPLNPDRNLEAAVSDFDFAPRRPQTIHDALGRPNPVVVHDGFKGMKGNLTLWLLDGDEFEAVLALLKGAQTLLYQNVLGQQWYLQLADSLPIKPVRAAALENEKTPVRHLHTISFGVTEVDRPAS